MFIVSKKTLLLLLLLLTTWLSDTEGESINFPPRNSSDGQWWERERKWWRVMEKTTTIPLRRAWCPEFSLQAMDPLLHPLPPKLKSSYHGEGLPNGSISAPYRVRSINSERAILLSISFCLLYSRGLNWKKNFLAPHATKIWRKCRNILTNEQW